MLGLNYNETNKKSLFSVSFKTEYAILDALNHLEMEIKDECKRDLERIHTFLDCFIKQYPATTPDIRHRIMRKLRASFQENQASHCTLYNYLQAYLTKHEKLFHTVGQLHSLEILLSSQSIIEDLPEIKYHIDFEKIIRAANQHGINLKDFTPGKDTTNCSEDNYWQDYLSNQSFNPAKKAIESEDLLAMQGVLNFESDLSWRRQLQSKLIEYYHKQYQNQQCKHDDILIKGIKLGRKFMRELVHTGGFTTESEKQAIEKTWKQINTMLNEYDKIKADDSLYQQAEILGLKIIQKETL